MTCSGSIIIGMKVLTREKSEKTQGSEIRKEAERIHECAMLASETQFEHAQRWRMVDRLLSGAAAVFAAVAGVGALSEVLTIKWAGLVAILSAAVGAVATSVGAAQITARATDSANAYRNLQQDARLFLNLDLSVLQTEEARQQLQQLVDRQQQLNRAADIPSPFAWARAKKHLSEGSQDYEVDQE
jgi:hypothetical protein